MVAISVDLLPYNSLSFPQKALSLPFNFTGKHTGGCFFLVKWQREEPDYKSFIVIQVIVPHIHIYIYIIYIKSISYLYLSYI